MGRAVERVVMFSGGVGSWAAAKRVAKRYGTKHLTLIFTDTKMEDEDLYRFLHEAACNVFNGEDPNLIMIADGRTPWQVFNDERFLGSSRVDPCSKILKRRLSERYLRENFDPKHTVVYVGIDWSEEHRFDDGRGGGLRPKWAEKGWDYRAPMCNKPYLTKPQMLGLLVAEGIKLPRLYELGFSHNNCGGFCVKAGMGHFALLLKTMPERYAYHEEQEQRIRRKLRKNVSILTDRRGGTKKPMTLKELRKRIERGEKIDIHEIGGCSCFIDVD